MLEGAVSSAHVHAARRRGRSVLAVTRLTRCVRIPRRKLRCLVLTLSFIIIVIILTNVGFFLSL